MAEIPLNPPFRKGDFHDPFFCFDSKLRRLFKEKITLDKRDGLYKLKNYIPIGRKESKGLQINAAL